MTTTTRHGDLQQPGRTQPTGTCKIGLIVALSMAAGLIAAVVLVAMPFIPATENALTGVMLLAFALGWALLAELSAFMVVAGLVSLSGSAAWPPVLFGIVVWMFLRVRREVCSRQASIGYGNWNRFVTNNAFGQLRPAEPP